MNKNIISTNKPPSGFWDQADKDYLVARPLFYCGAAFYGLSAYHSQQCLEKYLKSYTVQQTRQFLKTHDLDLLRQLAARCNEYFSTIEIREEIAQFNIYDQVTRYGAEAFYDPFHQKTKSIEISGAWSFGSRHIKILDKLVYNIRNMLEFGKVKSLDGLKAIIEEKKDYMLVSTWKLPIPLKKFLTIGNDYYK